MNVCILRIPKGESIITKRSHCNGCGNVLRWYELIPVLSFVLQKGRCRHCKAKILWQYPLVELANGLLWVGVFIFCGITWESVLFALCSSALLVLSIIDSRHYEIPLGCNLFILGLGAVRIALDLAHWKEYVIGFFVVSGFFALLHLLTKGRGIGGGDIKLMAGAGLLLGWKNIILAMVLGCIIGSVCHLLKMKITKADKTLAFGPYLSIGIYMGMIWGNSLINWYLGLLGL